MSHKAGVISPSPEEGDRQFEAALRPPSLSEFTGQPKVKEILSIAIQAARARGEAMDHVLLHGPPGLGKTTLAAIVAQELEVPFDQTSGPVLQKKLDLTGILSNIRDRQVFFIDEVHRLMMDVEEMLYSALEDYRVDILIGAGAGARTHSLPIPRFTCVAATTRQGLVSAPMRGRFGLVLRRNLMAVRIRMGDYAGVAEQGATLLAEADRLLGPGNDMAAGLHAELARAAQESGRYADALAQRQAVVQRAAAAAVEHPALALPPRAHALLARVLAQPGGAAAAVTEGHVLLAELARQAQQVGSQRNEARLSLARVGVVAGDAALAQAALAALRADSGAALARNPALASRVAQIDGQLARLQGDMPRSTAGLQERVGYYARTAEPQAPPAWAAALDLAATQALAGDSTGAAASLALAARWRPKAVPEGVPLDRLAAWLAARSGPAGDEAQAWQALAAAVGRSPGQAPATVLAAALL